MANLKTPVEEQALKTAASVLGGIAASSVLYSIIDPVIGKGIQKTQELFSKAARKCSGYGGQGALRDMCIAKYKIQALMQRRDLYRQALNKCKGRPNEEKCSLKIMPKINELDSQIKMLQDNIRIYRQGAIEAAKEETKAIR